jgi:hypothetical protein
MITLRLGRKPINGAAGRLGPPTSAVAKSAGHAERRTNHGWMVIPNGRFLADPTIRWGDQE